MLQQTQVERVIPKYNSFVKQFPSLATLARVSLGDVLIAWQGLGYNRRAKMLHACVQKIMNECGGQFPHTHTELMTLPGIGHYTAGAIMAFAFNDAQSIIETNIRSVYIHYFFKNRTAVTDSEILEYVTKTLDREHVRDWYYALMDYGAFLKKEHKDLNSKSKHYVRQSTFAGSDRQIRGALIRVLSRKPCTLLSLHKQLDFKDSRITIQLQKLCTEGMVIKKGRIYAI